jgi:signal transduction histidine kinase
MSSSSTGVEGLAEQRVRAIHGAGLVPFATVIINGAIVWLVIEGPRVSRGLFWCLALLAVTLVRGSGWWSFRRHGFSRRPAPAWRRFLGAAALANGILWGAGACLLFPSDSLPGQSLLAFVLGGMTAGAVVFSSADPLIFACFAAPALLPLAARFAVEGDALHFGMAFMTALFGLAMGQLTRTTARQLAEAVSLRLQNAELISQLSSANAGLERQVAERTAALDRSLAEQRRAGLLASLGRLASGIAHEINSPLAVVKANAQMLAVEATPERRASIEDILAAIERIRSVVSDMKSLSHAESETAATTELQPLLLTCIHLVEARLKGVGRVVQSIPPTAAVRGTRMELSHLMLQLLLNAAESVARRGRGDGLIEVSLSSDEAARCAVVDIADNGTSLPSEELPHLFEPFFDSPAKRGRAMSLAICHAIATSLGGKISAERLADSGTRMTVSLPIAGAH